MAPPKATSKAPPKPPTKATKRRKLTAGQASQHPRAAGFDEYSFLSKAHQEFYPKLEERNLLMERQVRLKSGEFPEFQNELNRRGWQKLGTYPAPAHIAIVREFYCNAKIFGDGPPTFKSYVRGTEVPFDAPTINAFLGTVLKGGNWFCQYTNWKQRDKSYTDVLNKVAKPGAQFVMTKSGNNSNIPRQDLLPIAQIWMAFIHSNLSPCSHTSDIQESRSLLLYAIMAKLVIDVGKLISAEIHECAHQKGALGHPSLVTHLCRKAGVETDDPPFQKLRQPINKTYIIAYCLGKNLRKTQQEAATSSQPPPPPASSASRSITQQLEALEGAITRSQQQNDALWQANEATMRGMTMMMDGIRQLSLNMPGLPPSFQFPSGESFAAHVAWPQYPGGQAHFTGGGGASSTAVDRGKAHVVVESDDEEDESEDESDEEDGSEDESDEEDGSEEDDDTAA